MRPLNSIVRRHGQRPAKYWLIPTDLARLTRVVGKADASNLLNIPEAIEAVGRVGTLLRTPYLLPNLIIFSLGICLAYEAAG
ncbi:MAG: hypothetical protein MJA27_13150 [Pseudanabaenales cyanobacterium]|nr:hypothetical protein [Pseudanabaenales cyanobacterium]